MDELPSVEEAIAAYDERIDRATSESVPILAASAGLLLGVLLERSHHPDTGARVEQAIRVLDRASSLEQPLRLARAFRLPGG